MQIRAIAVDDEPMALEIIGRYAEKTPFLHLEASFINALEAIDYLAGNEVDLIFLDIKMPDISGIEFYESLVKKPLLVFTTAYSEHAVKGFELEAIDYLLKPFALHRFLKACHKVKEVLESRKDTATHIFIKHGFDVIRIPLEDLLYVEATGNYMRYVLREEEFLSRSTLKETLSLLPEEQLLQVHRSFIVNCNLVDKLERSQMQVAGHTIPIGSSFLAQTKERLI